MADAKVLYKESSGQTTFKRFISVTESGLFVVLEAKIHLFYFVVKFFF